jgi:hypothetical protein
VLDDERAAEAEKLILDQVAGLAPGMVGRLAAQAACTVDPDGAAKRRERAEREEARVRFWRDNGGACALAAYGLPTDAALAANDAIETRARRYKQLKVRPGARLDQLRVLAFLDILNGITPEARLAQSRADAAAQHDGSAAARHDSPAAPGQGDALGRNPADATDSDAPDDSDALDDGWDACDWDAYFGNRGEPDDDRPGNYVSNHGEPDDDRPGNYATDQPDGDALGDHASGSGHGGAGGAGNDGSDGPGADRGANGDQDPAGASGPGAPDDDWFTGYLGDSGEPDDVSDAYVGDRGESAGRPRGSSVGTVGDGSNDTDDDGTCGNGGSGDPGGRSPWDSGGNGGNAGSAATSALPALAARANLTLPLATLLGLAERPGAGHGLGPLDPALVRDLAASAATSPDSDWCLTITDSEGTAVAHGCARPARTKKTTTPAASRDGPPGGTPWALTPRPEPGPPGGYGSWTLTLPGGRELVIKLLAVPVTDCDHRHESRGYQPNDTLRHLVQVRDGTCTFPTCSAHARESDFEHGVPYHQGGKTCACNGGARSRRCHRVKQSPGWTVTQPQPGLHQWTTPSGRTYTQGPMKYPT